MTCEGEPAKTSICHCNACRLRTGSAFGIAVIYRRGQVRVEGENRVFARRADSGFDVLFHFCPDCGSSVYWEPMRMPGLIAVGAGSFADPALPMPDQSVADDLRYPWIQLPPELARRGSQ